MELLNNIMRLDYGLVSAGCIVGTLGMVVALVLVALGTRSSMATGAPAGTAPEANVAEPMHHASWLMGS